MTISFSSFKKLTYITLISVFVFVGFGLTTNQAQAAISGGVVTSTDLVVGTANADYNVSFDTNTTSTATTITVTLPANYTITNGSLGTSAICNSGCATPGFISVDGVDRGLDSVIGSSTSRTIKATLTSGYDLGTGAGTVFRITTGITNATTSGATATSTITSNASGETAQTNVAGVTLTPATASVLVFTTQPSGSVSGIALTGQPVVTARDSFGNTDTNFIETLTATSSAGSLANNTSTASSGVATFSGLTYTATADQQSFTLTASSSALTVISSSTISDVIATKILVTTQPAAIISGVSMTQPVVQFVNAQNTLDTVARTDVVTITENGAGSITAGTTGVTATSGIATYSGLVYSANADDENVTFTFTDDAATNPSNFSGAPVNSNALVADVLATKLVSTVDPATCVSGLACTTQATIQAQNAQSLLDNDYITAVTAAETGLGSLVGTANQGAMTAGALSTVGLGYTATADQQSFTFTFDSGSLTQDVTASITADVIATKIIVDTAPTSSISGVSLTNPIIKYVNAQNTLDTAINATDTIAITFTGGGSLAGSSTISASSGVATFLDLVFTGTADHATSTFTFTDNAGGSKNVGTSTAVVDPNVLATKVVFTVQPSASVSGVSLASSTVVARNADNTLDTDYTTAVGLTLSTGAGSLSGTTSTASVAGVAAFTTVIYTATADQQSFSFLATSGSLTTATSSAVTSDVVATVIAFTTQPATSTSGIALVTQPVITARDANGTTDTGFTETITLTELSAGSLTNFTTSSVSGVATFATLLYTASADQEAFTLTADDDAGVGTNLATTTANALTSDVVATKTIVFTNPTSSVSGVSLADPVIHFVNAQNTLDTFANTDVVTAIVESGGGTVSNATTTASNGVATFIPLFYTATADQQTFVLRFADDTGGTNNFNSASSTASSTVSDVVATKSVFTVQPSASVSGVSLASSTVVARNADNTLDTDYTTAVGLTLSTGAGSLSGTTSTASVAGVAAFTTVIYTATADQQSFSFLATSGSLTTATSSAVTSDVIATKIIVFTNPTSSVSGVSMTQPVIRFVNAQNTLDIATTTDVVTASVLSGGGTVSGTTTSTASNGVSTFSALLYNATADQQAFVLSFADDAGGTNNFSSASTTASSTVSNVVATKFLVTLATTTAVAGSADTLTLTAANAGDVTDTGYSATGKTYTFVDASSTALSAHVPANSPATAPTIPSSSTIQAAFSSGVAALATFTLTKAEVLGTITASDGTLNGTSTSVTVRHATTTTFIVTASTATPVAGTAFNLTVLATDGSGNTANSNNSALPYTGIAFINASATAPYTLSPSSYPFVSGDAGTKTFTNGVTLNTVENGASVTVRDFADSSITGTVGSLNVSATADITAPTITSVQASTSTATTATIIWTTNESSSSTVEYGPGPTSNYGSSTTTSTLVTSHSISLTGLTSNTTYHFRVKSADAAGNVGTSVDNIFLTLNSDVTGPTISSQTPLDNATGTAVTVSPVLTFSEALDVSTINGVQLRNYSDDIAVSATVSYNPASTTVTIDPIASLANSTQYYLYAVGVKDAAGNALTTDYSSTTKATHEFTTTAESVTLAVTSITPSSTFATADSTYANGWSWKFNITVPTSEASSSMKFADWVSGSNTIAMFSSSTSTLRFYSAQSSNATSSASAIYIGAANTYPTSSLSLASDLDSATAGRQIQITVEARVPTGSSAGSYSTSYGVQSQ